ncbi:MAG: glycoside hydrolase family 15 [Spirochaetae bacterium HGW-Spirochaetae-10]|nr:MAG: glycoside hydrolase family 15 [Spirochaetae bacterium HGW-Spirochaetae-10]
MPRDIPVSNGSLLINFDSDYQIRDVYFPFIGQENHGSGHPFRFGVWVDGEFSWIGSDWEKVLKYQDNTLVTDVVLRNRRLGLILRCNDIVDTELNVYLKRIEVYNDKPEARHVHLFFYHDFNLYGNDIGGTAYYDPRSASIIHYKMHRYFLISCREQQKWGVRHFACGRREATTGWINNEENGELIGEPAAWGSPYSAIGIWMELPANGVATDYYWIAAGQTYTEVSRLNFEVHTTMPEALLNRTSRYWRTWIRKEALQKRLEGLPQPVADIFNRSLLILRTQIDNHGAIIAANDSDIVRFGRDTYSYMWGRDGAFVAAALARSGYSHVCMKYFDYCSRIISDEGYMFQHYNPDGSLASNWHSWLVDGKEVLPIQEDSTALTLWALWIHHENLNDIEFIRPLYHSLILKAADFLASYVDSETGLPLPSYDLWEERYATHAFTVTAVIAGLKAASRFADLFQDESRAERYSCLASEMTEALKSYLYSEELGRYARSGSRTEHGYKLDPIIDISLLSLATFGILDPRDPRMSATFKAIENELRLKSTVGGFARYQGDVYQREENSPSNLPGNPWFISTLWVAEYLIESATDPSSLEGAMQYFNWCVNNALPSGVLAEQVSPVNGQPLSVSPLTWSHSAYVWTVIAYQKKAQTLHSERIAEEQ